MFHRDFKEFIELLNNHGVEYLLVGGYALGIHGYPRYTGDMDIWVKPAQGNAEKVMAVLDEFGFSELELSTADFVKPGNVIQLGYPPHYGLTYSPSRMVLSSMPATPNVWTLTMAA
jgi:hypothetical protein